MSPLNMTGWASTRGAALPSSIPQPERGTYLVITIGIRMRAHGMERRPPRSSRAAEFPVPLLTELHGSRIEFVEWGCFGKIDPSGMVPNLPCTS